MSLVGKMNDVGRGDLIKISNSAKKMTAVGYVVKLKRHAVGLSHEDPFHPIPWLFNRGADNGFSGITRGDRDYILSSFTEYEILEKHKL